MSLRVPSLDERTFEQLVNEARAQIQRSCPTWTDLSPHDPGMVLVECLAHLTETLIFRFNRIPERVYVELLKLIGVRLLPPTAAEADVVFTLAKPTKDAVEIPAGTRVSVSRKEQSPESIVFTTAQSTTIPTGDLRAKARVYHAELVEGELLGLGTGMAGQAFRVQRPPIIAPLSRRPGTPGRGGRLDLEVGVEVGPREQPSRDRLRIHQGERYELWEERETFADAGPGDRVYIVDRTSGLVVFSPALAMDSTGTASGAQWVAPAAGRKIRIWYARGGGQYGNVLAGAIDGLQTALPGGAKVTVTNEGPATGGRAVETLANALLRGPRELHALKRAVTASDFELLAKRSGPIARARAFTTSDLWVFGEPGVIGVTLVPSIPDGSRGAADETLTRAFLSGFETQAARDRVAASLEDRRPLGTRCQVGWARYKPVGVTAKVRVQSGSDRAAVKLAALARINRLISPLPPPDDSSGDGGWPFHRSLRASQVYEALLADPAVRYVNTVRLVQREVPINVSVLEADPFQPRTFYAGDGKTLFRSVNAGDGWEPIKDFGGETVLRVACHPQRKGLLAVLTVQANNARTGMVRVSSTCGEDWGDGPAQTATLDGLEDLVWLRGVDAPTLLLAGKQGLHRWQVGKPPLQVGMPPGVVALWAVAVAQSARGDVSVAVATQVKAGTYLSRKGGQDGTFEPTGLVNEDIRVLRCEHRHDGRTFLWAGTASVGNDTGKGFYRCELLGQERKPEPWRIVEKWDGGSASCIAFQDNLALAGSYDAGVLWVDGTAEPLQWTLPPLLSKLPTREKERLFQPVRALAAGPDLVLAGGPVGIFGAATPRATYAQRGAPETENEVTLAPNWLFCVGEHDLDLSEDEA
jgi:hypothetical protein